ncbi:organomercurial lyase [Desulfopila aestuarii]|uniref:Alkylmercury lyase n=1 Tax=Desulfopila aestuarii DSM 18488 TaxID=1121416 RepID=A0A1M7Y8Q0_9BACT|nr:organomercurial lyase [Desulfopila aestuarii]SHO49012.1 Alkylmercury lyase [Desulfopila aestuarii DSM 18488]
MSDKVTIALDRLINVLPLKAKQENCGPEIKGLHQAVLRSFVDNGRILTREEMAERTSDLENAVRVLKDNDMVVFDDQGTPIGAYPFTMEQREHKVRINGFEVHAMCALDALSVSSMFQIDTLISSKCRVTGAPVQVQQSPTKIENIEEVKDVRFGIAWGAVSSCSCCANSLCMEMMFLKDKETADKWLQEDSVNREVFDLHEAVEFGSRFFTPLMN